MERILITGGAGFIGTHLAERLLAAGYGVRILDRFAPQVHGAGGGALPLSVRRRAEVMTGDVRSPAALRRALAGVDAVAHLAAAVGVGQSMYRITGYCAANVQGTAALLQAILAARRPPHRSGGVRRLLVASSMSVYGEGAYRCAQCGPVAISGRDRGQLERGAWEPHCPACACAVRAEPTREDKAAAPQSIYAITKLAQEQMVRCFGLAYGLPAVALRFFNVYGPRQALNNPYTGVAALFSARLLAGLPVPLYEDGAQMRDFIDVRDVAQACQLALESGVSGTYNIASGQPVTIAGLAEELAAAVGRPLRVERKGQFRMGDVRHCLADIAAARRDLGFAPGRQRPEGLADLAAWLRGQQEIRPGDTAAAELRAYGLGG